MDMDIKIKKYFMDIDFNEFWEAYKPDIIRFPNRKAATFLEWRKRSSAAQKAMLDYVKTKGAPPWKNPFFFVVDFPEPQHQTLSYEAYYAKYGTTEDRDGWRRVFIPEQRKTIYVKEG